MYNGVSLGPQSFDSDTQILTQIRSQNDHKNVKIKRENSLNLPISVNEVISAVQKAKVKKAVSVDSVPNEVLKNASSVECLTEFYNYCFKNSLILDMWRQSLIVNPQIRRWLNMLRLWNRIVGMNNTRLPKIIYEYRRSLDSKGNWCSEIKEIFSSILCNDVYENNVTIANVKVFLN